MRLINIKNNFTIIIILLILIVLISIYLASNHNNSSMHITSQELDVKKYIGLEKDEYKKFTGKNITVAIIDSGLQEHNDISKNRILRFKDFVNNRDIMYDDFGHGTFITGIIGANGKLTGIAPDVNFVILKALDKYGQTDENILCNSLKWIINNQNQYKIKIVNISFGVYAAKPYNQDQVCMLVEELTKTGIIVVCSAGNTGPTENTIMAPAISPDVISVGSCLSNYTYKLDDDKISYFSARGSMRNEIKKPDIVTLGTNILSLGNESKNGYILKSGTSVSTGIVSGCIAILLEKYRNSTSLFIRKYLLEKCTFKIPGIDEYSQGNGELILK